MWFWVLIAIVAGIVFGLAFQDAALEAKWLADAFIQLIKVITGPVIFVTVVIGIAGLGRVAKAGGIAVRALAYFFCATVVALALGLAAGQDLAIGEQLALAALMILTSKGAAGITGAGLVTLTASLQAFGGEFFTPESIAVGIALVVGIDRIMSEGRALTNAIGNSVATLVVAKWCGELDEERLKQALDEPAELDRATERALAGAAA